MAKKKGKNETKRKVHLSEYKIKALEEFLGDTYLEKISKGKTLKFMKKFNDGYNPHEFAAFDTNHSHLIGHIYSNRVNLINAPKSGLYFFGLEVVSSGCNEEFYNNCYATLFNSMKSVMNDISNVITMSNEHDVPHEEISSCLDKMSDLTKEYGKAKNKNTQFVKKELSHLSGIKFQEQYIPTWRWQTKKAFDERGGPGVIKMLFEDYDSFMKVYDMFNKIAYISIPLNKTQIEVQNRDKKIKFRHHLNGLRYRIQVHRAVPIKFLNSLKQHGKVEIDQGYTVNSVQLENKNQVMILKMTHGEHFVKSIVNASYEELDKITSVDKFLKTYSWES